MQQTEGLNPVTQQILTLLSTGKTRTEISEELTASGHDAYFVKNIVAEAVKLHYAKSRTRGLMLTGIGAVICLLGCVLTIVLSYSGGGGAYILYGATCVGIVLIFAGLVKIF